MALFERELDKKGFIIKAKKNDKVRPILPPNLTEPLLGDDEVEEYMDRFSSLFDLWIKCESQRQQHRLSAEYFQHWEFWASFVPLTCLTSIIAIASFLVGTDLFDQTLKNYVSIGVGVIASISIAVQNYANDNKYATRNAMHEQTAMSLKKLADAIEFAKIDPKQNLNWKRDKYDTSLIDENYVEKYVHFADEFSACRQVYDQCLLSCDSALPLRISQPFLLVESRLAMGLRDRKFQEKVRDKLGGRQDDPDGRLTIYESAYDEIFCSISNAKGWPW